jgi:hypothetical protein
VLIGVQYMVGVRSDIKCRYDNDEYHCDLEPFAMPNIDNFSRKHI